MNNPNNPSKISESAPEAIRSRKENQNTGNKTVEVAVQKKAKISSSPKVVMKDFTDCYSLSEINADQKYVKATESRIGIDSNEQKLAKDFERFFIHGVLNGGWLGRRDTNGITAAAAPTCKYDDYKNRIDVFSSLYHRSEKDGKLYASTIGIDVTISGDKGTIMDKLTRTSNDNVKRSFGFSKLKYFTNGRDRYPIENIPRYVIGVSNYDVKDIQELTKFDPRTGLLNFNTSSVKNLEYRFKVLSEMYTENQLYLSKKPKELTSDAEKKAYDKLINMDSQLKQALLRASKEIARKGYLGVPSNLEGDKLISAIEAKIISKSKQYFEEEKKELRLKRPDLDLNSKTHTDTYVQIITCARELMKTPPASH